MLKVQNNSADRFQDIQHGRSTYISSYPSTVGLTQSIYHSNATFTIKVAFEERCQLRFTIWNHLQQTHHEVMYERKATSPCWFLVIDFLGEFQNIVEEPSVMN